MKLVLTTLLFGFLGLQQAFAMPMTPPFSEDFESFPLCPTCCGAVCQGLPNG